MTDDEYNPPLRWFDGQLQYWNPTLNGNYARPSDGGYANVPVVYKKDHINNPDQKAFEQLYIEWSVNKLRNPRWVEQGDDYLHLYFGQTLCGEVYLSQYKDNYEIWKGVCNISGLKIHSYNFYTSKLKVEVEFWKTLTAMLERKLTNQ